MTARSLGYVLRPHWQAASQQSLLHPPTWDDARRRGAKLWFSGGSGLAMSPTNGSSVMGYGLAPAPSASLLIVRRLRNRCPESMSRATAKPEHGVGARGALGE